MDDDEDFDDDTISRVINFSEDTSVMDLATMEGYLSLKGNRLIACVSVILCRCIN